MTRNVLSKAVIAVVCLCGFAFAIPSIKITTATGQDPQQGAQASGQNCINVFNHQYIKMSSFSIEGAANSAHNITVSDPTDSIRVRGNSSAAVGKKPYRIKFDKTHGLFGKPAAKSWTLLANHYDSTFAMNAAAFRLGQKMYLEFTPSSVLVKVYINNTYKGIFQLTEQIQDGPGRIDIDSKNGWAVEFDYHCADNNDIRWQTTWTFNNRRDSLGTFIVVPDVDAPPYNTSNPKVAHVPGELKAIVDRFFNAAEFNEGKHRCDIDLTSFVKYIMIQQFMDNGDFNGRLSSSTNPGSNYAYKDFGGKLKGGPLWDFDLAAGFVLGFGTGGGLLTTYQNDIMPRHSFYQRFFDDPVFRARYKKTWDENKVMIKSFAENNGFIDSLRLLLRDEVQANYAITYPCTPMFPGMPCQGNTGGGNFTAAQYDALMGRFKTWWNNRHTFFDTEMAKIAAGTDISEADINAACGGTVDPNNFTLQTSRDPSNGGSISVSVNNGAAQNNPASISVAKDASVTATASTNANYTFQGWTTTQGKLPDSVIAKASQPSITFPMTGNMILVANFAQEGDVGGNLTLTVARNPEGGGVIMRNNAQYPGQSNHNSGDQVTLTAQPNNGYTFTNWAASSGVESDLPSGISTGSNRTNPTVTFNMSRDRSLIANFTWIGGDDGPINRDTLTVQAEHYTQRVAQGTPGSGTEQLRIGVSSAGDSIIGYIENGNSATYTVTVPAGRGGRYMVEFRLASEQGIRFTMSVGGQSVGTMEDSDGTRGWDAFMIEPLTANNGVVTLTEGANTFTLNFQGAVNLDYIRFISEAATSIRPIAVRSVKNTRTKVTLRPSVNGFSALLPANHTYTSYKLIDLQGREIRKGKIGAGTADLRLNNVKPGVLFLKLDGTKGSTTLRATVVR